MVGGNLVSWKSKKHVVTAKSSAEAEYRIVAHRCCELLWLRILMEELGFKHCNLDIHYYTVLYQLKL